MATHNVTFLKQVDKIIVIEHGEITAQGTYSELKSNNILSDLILGNSESDQNQLKKRSNSGIAFVRSQSVQSEEGKNEKKIVDDSRDPENFEIGEVKMTEYFAYIKCMGVLIFIAVNFCQFFASGAEIGASFWLTQWVEEKSHQGKQLGLILYAVLVVIEGIFIYSGCLLFYTASIRATKTLHQKLLYQVLRSPLSFFDLTPLGRVLNRFSRDISTIDMDISAFFLYFVMQMTFVPMMMLMICLATPYLLILLLIISIIYYLVYVSLKQNKTKILLIIIFIETFSFWSKTIKKIGIDCKITNF